MVENFACGKEHGSSPMTPQPSVSTYFALKAWPTRIVGSILLIPAVPVIGLLVLMVKATSSGPGLYRQTRTGKDGKEFQMYKIRTMFQDAESVSGPTWCKPGDSRITPLGRILRLLHLDELPQLINIVRGEMDLIGPRPERPAFVEMLSREIPGYCDRLQVLPGVTGLAQVNLPPDETVNCVRKKLVLDRDYIQSASMSLDIRILVCTSLRMLGIRHGRAVRMFRLERDVDFNVETPAKPSPKATVREDAGHSKKRQPVLAGSRSSSSNGHDSGLEDVYAGFDPEPVAAATQATSRPR
jgi:lipopolysaccharide/colanic/teichoic acid biosynthesis glycosyltransferase